ncbi:MAG: ribbon-helix-helix protein, CopG family [Chloroflexi bacterium]|nr:ribbon-helix-helix protein, CopG family [Chloroflexota bacterium]
MSIKTVRRSINITPEMRDLLAQLAAKQGRDVTESDLIRDAIRQYLDQQADLVGSRRHFQKSLQERLDALEGTLTFHLHILISLVSVLLDNDASHAVDEAIVAARRDGKRLLARIDAVRDLSSKP